MFSVTDLLMKINDFCCLPPPPPPPLCVFVLHFPSFTHPPAALPPVQSYYNNRTNLPPTSASRGVPPSSGPRPVAPTHVYQAGSQMMMIPGQQLPFPSSPQGPAYFIPGQVRTDVATIFTRNPPKTHICHLLFFP